MLSALQKFILKQGRKKHGRVAVDDFLVFYGEGGAVTRPGLVTPQLARRRKAVRKSIDRLIKRELVVGYGEKTRHRLYLNEVRLTPQGRKAAKELGPKQQKLL